MAFLSHDMLSSRAMKMLRSSYTQAMWRTPSLWTSCRDQPQQHTGQEGTQEHFVGQAATPAGSPDSSIGLSWAGTSRPSLCRHTEKPEPRSIWKMPALQETDIWQGVGGWGPPNQKRCDIMMPCFAQRCDTGHPLVCTWVLTSPELVSLSMLNPLVGSGIPAPAALQSNSLSLSISNKILMTGAIIDAGNKQTNSEFLYKGGFFLFAKQAFLTRTHPGSKKIYKEISRSKGWSSGSEEVPSGWVTERAGSPQPSSVGMAGFVSASAPRWKGRLSKNKMHNWASTV